MPFQAVNRPFAIKCNLNSSLFTIHYSLNCKYMITADQLKDIQDRADALYRYLDIEKKKVEFEEEDLRTQAPDFWEDPERAQEQMKLVKDIKKWLDGYEEVRTATDELALAMEFYRDEMVTEEEVDADYERALKAIEDLGVMLEVARLLQNDTTLAIGVDLVCFDAEDYGTPQWAEKNEDSEKTWALGAQYWAKNLPEGYNPQFGILLDMVGGQGAKIYQEHFSLRYAASIVDKVWSAARHAGFSSVFANEVGGGVTDDHIPVNEAGIPTVDIIPFYPDCRQSSFGPTWHTINDDMEHLDINTLKAVGQTLIQVIYSE